MGERPKGKGRRQLNKFDTVRPSEEVSQKYLLYYTGEELWFHPESAVRISSPTLFGNTNPLVLDIGCGRGEYLVSMAQMDESVNHVGIDNHTKSLWDAANRADRFNLDNVKFARIDAKSLAKVVPEDTVSEVHMMFPPPTVSRNVHIKRDFLKPDFIGELHKMLQRGGRLHLATDHKDYFNLKRNMILETGLFAIESVSEAFEGGVTWYQSIWERHGFPTLRAVFKRI